MSLNKLRKIVILAGTRTVILYLFVFLLLNSMVNHDNALDRAKLRVLNRVAPFMDRLAEFIEQGEALSDEKLKKYFDYYKIVDAYIPGRDDVKAMLGFCYYHLGEHKKAISAYRESIGLNPYFFWSHYNLGVLYFQDEDYEKAQEEFQAALEIKQAVTVKILYASKLYQDILGEMKNPQDVVRQGLIWGYRDGYRLQQKAKTLGKGQGLPLSREEEDAISLRIF